MALARVKTYWAEMEATAIATQDPAVGQVSAEHYFEEVLSLQKKDTFMTFWAEQIFFCHTYDTSMTIIVTKPGIIIDVVGSYFYDKKS